MMSAMFIYYNCCSSGFLNKNKKAYFYFYNFRIKMTTEINFEKYKHTMKIHLVLHYDVPLYI